MNLVPFTEEMLPDASRMLALRHQRNRAARPELPERFEDAGVAIKAIGSLLTKPDSRGFAALHEGKLLAFLIGETSLQPWGRSGYVYLPGCGLAEGASSEIIQNLYALLGETWNQAGCFNHYAYICAADTDMVEAWFNLGFGKERVDALLDLRATEMPAARIPAGVEIRRVVKGDGDHLAELSDTIWRHQSRAPRWHPMAPEETIKQRDGWAEIAETESDMAYLAFEGGQALGSLAFFMEEEQDDNLSIPPHCRYMTIAATRESARGRGIGAALAWHGLRQIRENGAEFCLTNWQSANLLAASFWPRFGFQPVAYRLARTINPMIAWAKG